ncbi:subtilisin-like protein, partial [Anaeromyces robustus]
MLVSSAAGGSLLGVAKKANIHMVGVGYSIRGILNGLDFVKRNAIPHKSVISISSGHRPYYQSVDEKFDDLVNNEGFIIFVSGGNDDKNGCQGKKSNYFHGNSAYRKAIAVGATTSKIINNKYYRASYSNFGDCIDIFAPGTGIAAKMDKNKSKYSEGSGTSYATPLVAGVAA